MPYPRSISESMYDELVEAENISRMIHDGKKMVTPDQQLALYMHRFNLDRDTVETMPAFQEHCKVMFHREIEKE